MCKFYQLVCMHINQSQSCYIMCAAIPPPKRKRFIGKPREEKTPINAQTYTRDASARLASAVAGGDEESDHVFR